MEPSEIKNKREEERADAPVDEEACCGYLPGAECAACGGRCCREHGCVLAPDDLMRVLSAAIPAATVPAAAVPAAAVSAPADTVAVPAGPAALLQEQRQPDVVPDRGTLLALLQDQKKGLYAIEYVSMPQGTCFYIRMRHKCYTFIGVEAMGECVALGKGGCMFSQEDRPRGGKMLKSSPDRRCVQHYTAEQMCADWKPYQELLSGIYREWYARMRDDGTFESCDEEYFAWMRDNHAAHNVSGW